MRISFICNYVFNGWEPTDTRLGGTERGVVEWAEELAKRGHRVMVYHNERTKDWDDFTYRSENEGSRGDGTYNGVWYMPREAYTNTEAYEPEGETVYINIKSPEIEPKEPTIFYTNDVDANTQDLSKYGAVIHISNWAKDNIPVNNDNVFVVPHGFDNTQIYPGKKINKQCFYASSPDRGLDTLLRAWPKVHAAHPDATLKVTYGATEYDLPGVEFLGEISEEEMNQLYKESDIWCHPCNGGELQCITGLKAQAAGCVPVIIPAMALSETVKYGFFSNEKRYTETLIRALSLGGVKEHKREMLAQEHYLTIEESTNKLLKVVDFVLDGHTNRTS